MDMTWFQDNWWILVLVALVILALIIGLAVLSRRKRLESARSQAAGLRDHAREHEDGAASLEDRAAELQGRSREAQQRADELHDQADRATRAARAERDKITGEYVEADDIDPDARRGR